MTDAEIRIAIAEACGWVCDEKGYWSNKLDRYGKPAWYPLKGLNPDYAKDLNAMNEAEKTLTDEEWDGYSCLIYNAENDPELKATNKAMIHAPARRRAEAFCRVKGIWKET